MLTSEARFTSDVPIKQSYYKQQPKKPLQLNEHTNEADSAESMNRAPDGLGHCIVSKTYRLVF